MCTEEYKYLIWRLGCVLIEDTISVSTSFQANETPTVLNRQGVVIENGDRQNESTRQRRLQEQPIGPHQPPGTDGEKF